MGSLGAAKTRGQKTSSYGGVCIRIYPGQYWDEETGLHWNWFRYYDPGVGRYIRVDPIKSNEEISSFVYALNNPILYIDFSGLSPTIIIDKKKCAALIANAMAVCGKEFDQAMEKWHKKLAQCKKQGNDCYYCAQEDNPDCDKFEHCNSSKTGYAQQKCIGEVCAKQPQPWKDVVEETATPACKKALKKIPFGCLKTPKKFPSLPTP